MTNFLSAEDALVGCGVAGCGAAGCNFLVGIRLRCPDQRSRGKLGSDPVDTLNTVIVRIDRQSFKRFAIDGLVAATVPKTQTAMIGCPTAICC